MPYVLSATKMSGLRGGASSPVMLPKWLQTSPTLLCEVARHQDRFESGSLADKTWMRAPVSCGIRAQKCAARRHRRRASRKGVSMLSRRDDGPGEECATFSIREPTVAVFLL